MKPEHEAVDADEIRDGLPEPAERPLSWELLENGRYMPRRTRGSCIGRELG